MEMDCKKREIKTAPKERYKKACGFPLSCLQLYESTTHRVVDRQARE